MGETVIAVCRSTSEQLNSLGVRRWSTDITSDEVANLVKRLKGIPIDVLVNNAGILKRNTLDNLDFDSIRQQFEVNSLGALRITHALLPNLSAGSKVAVITSRMGSIADNTSGSSYGYRMSKRLSQWLVEVFPRFEATANCCHPPSWYGHTDMTGHSGTHRVSGAGTSS